MSRLAPVFVLAGLLFPGSAFAQEAVDTDPPAHIAFVDGTAVIERDGKPDNAPANMPLLAGDRVRTETGRAEILFADGSTLHLDNFTTVDFQSDELVRVLDGRVRLTITGRSRDLSYRLDAAGAWAQVTQPGEYRLALMRRDREVETEFAVLRGAGELVNEDGRTALRAGERAFAREGAAPSHAYVFNSAAWDAFDRWSESRRDHRLGLSSQYLPEQVRPYSRAFDNHGSWRHEPTYGYVWYPTVRAGWRPYFYGRWATLRPYGWVWVGTDPWDWPTHHYGRWGFSAGSWFWIPGRTWGPAWVSWAYAPGYVSWCPLGWNNRPVFSVVNVNLYRGYDPWRAWTVVPRHHFGLDYVHRRGIAGHALDTRVRQSFEFRDTAPDFRGYAVPRSGAPIRVAGSRVGTAVPRTRGGSNTSPVYTNLDPNDSRVRSGSARIQVGEPGGRGAVEPGNRGAEARRAESVETGSQGAAARERAAPRAEGERPRMVPERGVRSLPPSASESRGAPAPEIRSPGTPYARPRDNGPVSIDGGYRRAPMPSREPPAGAPPERTDSPVRAVPRTDGGDGAGVRPPGRHAEPRRAPEPSAPATLPPRIERRAPEPSAPPSMPPPRIERGAPPRSADAPPPPQPERSAPPARSRPGDASGGARRRDR